MALNRIKGIVAPEIGPQVSGLFPDFWFFSSRFWDVTQRFRPLFPRGWGGEALRDILSHLNGAYT